MKNLNHSILFVLMPLGLLGQTVPCVTCFEKNPSTVTITDPARYSDMVPCSSGTGIPNYQHFYQRNRFKWYENSPGGDWEFKVKQNLYPGGSTYMVEPNTSPFVAASSSTTFPYLRNLLKEDLNPDNLPADGWELIRQDFGFANYNNTGTNNGPDNLTSTDEQPLSQIEDCNGLPTNQMCGRPSFQQNIGYIVLYNKYSATLRVLGLVTTSLAGNFVYVRLEIPRQFGRNGTGYPTNANGLFAFYDSPYRHPDQETRVSTVGVYAKKLNQNFFFADFQLAYDPCICLFNSQMDFSFLVGTQSSLAGVGVNAGDSPQSLDLITGMWDKDGANSYQYDAQSNMFGFQSADAMALQLDKLIDAVDGMDPNKKSKWKQEIMFLKTTLKIGSSLAKKSKPGLSTAFDIVGYLVDYGSFLGESKPKIKPTTMAISGTVTTLAGSDLVPKKIKTPGSLGAGSVVQEFPTQEQSQTVSPIYNSAPGVVAILSQPKVKYYEKFEAPGYGGIPPIHYWCASLGRKDMGYLFDPGSFQYTINPILDVKNVELYGSISFVHEQDRTFVSAPNYFNAERVTVKIDNPNNTRGGRRTSTRKSPVVSLSCLGNIPIMVKNEDFLECALSSDFAKSVTTVREPVLHVSFFIELNSLNSKGENVVITQVFKLPLKVNDLADNTAWDQVFAPLLVQNKSPFNQNNGIPSVLNVNGMNFTMQNVYDNIYAHEEINLSGSFNNYQRTATEHIPVNFISGREINLEPGTSLNAGTTNQPLGDIVLQIGSPYTNNCPPILPTPHSSLQNYCFGSTSTYKAKTFHSRAAVASTEPVLPPIVSNTKMGYPIPNPTTGTCAIGFDLAESGSYEMYMSNALGLRVKDLQRSDFAKAGNYTVQFNTENLEAGVYFITLTANGFRQARKLVVVK